MNRLSRFLKRLLRWLNYNGAPVAATYQEELNRQCDRMLLPAILIIIVAWPPYIPIDIRLHPEEPMIMYLRIGLTVVGLFSLIMHRLSLPRFKMKATFLMVLIAVYLQVGAALLTGLTRGDPVYIGGYLFIIMLSILPPLRKRVLWIILATSISTFFLVGHLKGMNFSGAQSSYSLRDLFFTSLVAFVFVFFLDKLRYRAWSHAKMLEKERNSLKLRNSMIEKELEMARRIQQSLIPSRAPGNRISAIYKPMDMVGGDFYDFIRFRNTNKVGIFLSDVSGHGVPAAFITSMIKSFIIQAGELRNDPANLFLYINELLVYQTGYHFVTAFYGIFDYETREFVYCNAGHNPPYVVEKNKIIRLENETKGIPLAVLTNRELGMADRIYQNSTKILHKKSKLVLYTDGLVEAVNPMHLSRDFEQSTIYEAFRDMSGLPCKEFVSGLYHRLVEFRGNENFEDDVCLICVDV